MCVKGVRGIKDAKGVKGVKTAKGLEGVKGDFSGAFYLNILIPESTREK